MEDHEATNGFGLYWDRVKVTLARFREAAGRAVAEWQRRVASCRNGLARYPGEHFSVFIAAPGADGVIELKSPILGYYADPFIWKIDGRAYVFCEEFRYLRNRGFLRCITLDKKFRPTKSRRVAIRTGHVSFPYLIEESGILYMIPETREEGGIHLYRCDGTPERWTRLRTLVPHLDAVDTVVFQYDGSWWLITSLAVAGNPDARSLAIFFADSLYAEKWEPHPINETRLYSELPYGSGRNAGAVVVAGSRLFRPSQENRRYYGAAIDWMEIITLSKSEYVECPLSATHEVARMSRQFAVHHITAFAGLVAWDIRDKVWSASLNSRAKASRWLAKSYGRKLATLFAGLE